MLQFFFRVFFLRRIADKRCVFQNFDLNLFSKIPMFKKCEEDYLHDFIFNIFYESSFPLQTEQILGGKELLFNCDL